MCLVLFSLSCRNCETFMFVKLRNKIESKRGSRKLKWRFGIWCKDLVWRLGAGIQHLRQRMHLKLLTRPIFETSAFNSDSSAEVEIHSLTGHRHLPAYLLAIKSLLRFYNQIAVVVHDDGSLTPKDCRLLKRQIIGIKIISRQKADSDIVAVLENYPKSRDYRRHHLIACQLFDYFFFSNADKIISLDSDTLFFQKPREIIDWATGDKDMTLSSYQKAFSSEPDEGLYSNICVGLMCYNKDIFDLGLIEELVSEIEQPEWGTTQHIYRRLVKAKQDIYPLSFLESEKYQSLSDFHSVRPTFRHYWLSSGLHAQYRKDIKSIVREIKKKGNGQ